MFQRNMDGESFFLTESDVVSGMYFDRSMIKLCYLWKVVVLIIMNMLQE